MSYKWLDRTAAMPTPYVTLVTSEVDFIAAMKHCKVKNPGDWILGKSSVATAHMLDHLTDGLCVIVAINITTQSGPEIAGLLVHEAVHIVQHYFEDIHEHTPASEQQAYAIQLVSQNLMEEYVRQVVENGGHYGSC